MRQALHHDGLYRVRTDILPQGTNPAGHGTQQTHADLRSDAGGRRSLSVAGEPEAALQRLHHPPADHRGGQARRPDRSESWKVVTRPLRVVAAAAFAAAAVAGAAAAAAHPL